MYYTFTDTPAGTLLLTGDEETVTGMYWKVFKRTPLIGTDWIENKAIFAKVVQQLDEYFAGKRHQFELNYAATDTPFQHKVWQELEKLPYGHICTYKDIAVKIGHPGAVRAVGSAVGNNPLSIVAPCHRVLGAGGRLTGYAGGIKNKETLLKLEGIAASKE
jgi:methylated-DNA-[protein]-cysteine S-methyltransferase